MNSWGTEWGNKGTFKAQKDCLKQPVIYSIYFYVKDLIENEKIAWNKLNEDKPKYLKEMSSIRRPICKRSAEIDRFEIVERYKLKCPYKSKCEFDI